MTDGEPTPQLTEEETAIGLSMGGKNAASFASGSRMAGAPTPTPAAAVVKPHEESALQNWIHRMLSPAQKPEGSGSGETAYGGEHNPAISLAAVGVRDDGTIHGAFKANEAGKEGAPMIELPPGASRQQILQQVQKYLQVTDVFPGSTAERFLNDKDGSFLKQAQAFVDKQNASDANDKSYAQPILDSMKLAMAQYSAAPAVSSTPVLSTAPTVKR